jgi:hypothetical protein
LQQTARSSHEPELQWQPHVWQPGAQMPLAPQSHEHVELQSM